MPYAKHFELVEPTRAQIDALSEPTVLEFGTEWCGYCQAAAPLIEQAFQSYANVRHMKVEDGKGRPLGRSFRVKLWPTLVFIANGTEQERLVRPTDADSIESAIARLMKHMGSELE
jgi:thioredoxin 1